VDGPDAHDAYQYLIEVSWSRKLRTQTTSTSKHESARARLGRRERGRGCGVGAGGGRRRGCGVGAGGGRRRTAGGPHRSRRNWRRKQQGPCQCWDGGMGQWAWLCKRIECASNLGNMLALDRHTDTCEHAVGAISPVECKRLVTGKAQRSSATPTSANDAIAVTAAERGLHPRDSLVLRARKGEKLVQITKRWQWWSHVCRRLTGTRCSRRTSKRSLSEARGHTSVECFEIF